MDYSVFYLLQYGVFKMLITTIPTLNKNMMPRQIKAEDGISQNGIICLLLVKPPHFVFMAALQINFPFAQGIGSARA